MEAFDEGSLTLLFSVFLGDQKKCRRSLNSKHLYDCCYHEEKDGRGIYIGFLGGECNEEERDLYLAVLKVNAKK